MRLSVLCLAAVMCAGIALAEDKAPQPDKDGFYSLFDGKSLDGWKAGEVPETFKVEDGHITVNGKRAHLFYVGPVNGAKFTNFHLKAEVMCFPKANSGIYFHTEFQDKGWPSKGFECQVNNTHSDIKKTGGLYSVKDVLKDSPAKDEEWFKYEIIVEGKHVIIKINDKVTCDWTQPDDWQPPKGMDGRKIGTGTIALQGHDPISKVYFKNIMIKPLP